MDLANKHCVPCEGEMPPATKEEAEILIHKIKGWKLSGDAKHISREFTFENFLDAMGFANK